MPVTKFLGIETGIDETEEEFKAKRLSMIDINDPANTDEDRAEKKKFEKSWLVRTFSSFDNKYLRPIFTDPHND